MACVNGNDRHDGTADDFGCRIRTLHFGRSHFRPHYNWAVGRHVRSEADFKDALNQCAEDNSRRTGTDHTYEYRHPEDVKPFSEADQVLDDRARNLSLQGKMP
jgi:hypothetical protein